MSQYLPWIFGYLVIGAAIGLIRAELDHQNSSDGFRSPGYYALFAWGFALMWPMLLIVGSGTP
jgi:hypothetical protein